LGTFHRRGTIRYYRKDSAIRNLVARLHQEKGSARRHSCRQEGAAAQALRKNKLKEATRHEELASSTRPKKKKKERSHRPVIENNGKGGKKGGRNISQGRDFTRKREKNVTVLPAGKVGSKRRRRVGTGARRCRRGALQFCNKAFVHPMERRKKGG